MDTKEYFYGFGLLVTLVLGLSNLISIRRSSQKSEYIRTITTERIKWIGELRKNMSAYVGKLHNWRMSMSADEPKVERLLEELDVLAFLIRLQLNPREQPDSDIEKHLSRVRMHTSDITLQRFDEDTNQLIKLTQSLLKKEWGKVKEEALFGQRKSRSDVP